MRSRRRRSLLSALLAVGLVGVAAVPTHAEDSVTHENDNITYQDDSGEDSTLTITSTRTQIVISQGGNDTIDESSAACTGDGTSTVTCTPDGPPEFDTFEHIFLMADGVDNVTADGELGVLVLGEGGNDVLIGSDTNGSPELMSGGDGNDQINTRNVGPSIQQQDSLDGFFDPTIVGDDAHGGSGDDLIATGNGHDFATGDGEANFIFGLSTRSQRGADGFGEGDNPGTDQISTGAGNDDGDGGSGNGDQVNLGEGEDNTFTFGGDGTGDVYVGGPGIDDITFFSTSEEEQVMLGGSDGGGSGLPFDDFGVNLASGAVTKSNTGSPSTNESDTATEFEDAFTDAGNDTVVGSDSSNVITAGPGTDTVNPGNGADAVNLDFPGGGGGILATARGSDGAPGPDPIPGNDAADVRDGFGDRVICGGGTDTVQADQFDEVASDCEVVTREERRAGGADVIAPDCTLGSVKSRYSRRAFLRGFNVRITCSEGATLVVQLLTKWTKKLFPSRAGDVVLAEKSATVTAGSAGTVKVRPAKKFRKRFRRKGFRVRVNVEARDQYGNRSIERKTVRIKKAKKKRKRR